jgi:hypothetical protein
LSRSNLHQKVKRESRNREKGNCLSYVPYSEFQITLAPDKHSDSRDKFFNQYQEWTKDLKEFDVVAQFGWRTPNSPSCSMIKSISLFILSGTFTPLKSTRTSGKSTSGRKKIRPFRKLPKSPWVGMKKEGWGNYI